MPRRHGWRRYRGFGLGAKTNAGYGWFSTDDALQTAVRVVGERIAKNRKEEAERAALEAETRQKEQERLERKRRDDAAMSTLTPNQREDYRETTD